MNARFHTPSFGDEVFDLVDAPTSTPTSNFVSGNNNSSYLYQQQTPPSAKHMKGLQNTSDEYHTADEESFYVTENNSMNHPVIQNITVQNNVIQGREIGIATATSTTGPTTMAARKQMQPVDQIEPAKPLSAYALFFRDTVSAIKQQNPTCSFQELSKIVASMWDALDPVHKGVYNKKNELARVEYLKQMRIFQQQQQQKQEQPSTNNDESLHTDTNGQQQTTAQQAAQPLASNLSVQQNTQQVNNNLQTGNSVPTSVGGNSGGSSEEQIRLTNDTEAEQKCIRENCNKRAIINPDWEDEYCSNECVIIHCRNVFNDWVQSNVEARQQQQQHATTT